MLGGLHSFPRSYVIRQFYELVLALLIMVDDQLAALELCGLLPLVLLDFFEVSLVLWA